ncbi:MAG TPA: hypothetical protein DCF82_05665 [Marinobacter hydrocarbonoclasticus]|uniref:Uncharacterized protein n=1 Tax=Marinobacter nauticus TaxID=2743 RepID=A0A3B8WBK5_MARNT|nr:hypothetical protein [Marinobacter nauticus]
MQRFLKEDATFRQDERENAAFQAVAKAWNQIHRLILAQGKPCTTNVIGHGIFFIFDGELLTHEWNRGHDQPDFNATHALYEFETDAGALEELLEDMRQWLADPTFIFPESGEVTVDPSLNERLGFSPDNRFLNNISE